MYLETVIKIECRMNSAPCRTDSLSSSLLFTKNGHVVWTQIYVLRIQNHLPILFLRIFMSNELRYVSFGLGSTACVLLYEYHLEAKYLSIPEDKCIEEKIYIAFYFNIKYKQKGKGRNVAIFHSIKVLC